MQSISNTHKDNVFFQATLEKPVWDLAVQVMDAFEQMGLKQQVTKASSRVHKLEFKQNYLAPIRTLEMQVQCELLRKVLDRRLSLTELQAEASKRKQIIALKKQFTKLTNVSSWSEAQEKYPLFATEDQLHRFIGVDVRKGVTKAFEAFCQRARSFSESASGPESASILVVRENTATVVVAQPSEVSGSFLRRIDPAFQGAGLTISSASSHDDTEYTIKEINSFFGCNSYVSAAICTTESYVQTLSTWKRAFGRAEALYVINTSLQKGMYILLILPGDSH